MEPSSPDLGRSLERLERRVAALELALAAAGIVSPAGSVPVVTSPAALPGPGTNLSIGTTEPAVDDQPLLRPEWMAVPALIGRTFIALAGAYLLRALTDSGFVRPSVGITAGLLYAGVWFAYADRKTATHASAAFHGLVGALVAFPVIWEATTRFQLLTPGQTSIALAGVAAVGLIVAAHRRLHAVAWIVSLLGAAAAGALIPATDRIVPFATFSIALGVATLWLGYVRDWLVLRWPIAFFADFVVIGITVRVAAGHGVEGPAAALAIQILLIAGYLISIIIRTLVRGRDAIPFEMVQGVLALAVGLGGAVALAGAATAGAIAVGVVTLLLGGSCYALAFIFVVRRQGMRANFYFYTTLGVMLVLASTHLLFETATLTVVLAAATVASGVVASRTGPRFLVMHAAIYATAGAIASSLLSASTFRLLAPVTIEWPAFTWPMVLAVAAPAACEALPLPKRAGTWERWSPLPRLLLLLLTMWGGAGWVIELIVRGVLGGSAAVDPGVLATVRTGILSVAALGLGRLGRSDAFREARWVVYPVLLAGGVKLLMEDLPRSRPSTLFAAFAAYGIALIVAPRLYGRHAQQPAGRPPETELAFGALAEQPPASTPELTATGEPTALNRRG